MSMLTALQAAMEFPLMDKARLGALADDIRANGLREPIVLLDGKILDGRNRYAACALAGVEPAFTTADPGIDPWAYVWSLNGERRDLTADQRYLIWKSCTEHSGEWQAEAARIKAEGNAKRAEAARERERKPDGTLAPASGATTSPTTGPIRTRDAKAEASKTNRGSVERMDKLTSDRPDLAAKVKSGELPAAAAIREAKRETLVANLEDIATRTAKAVQGVYDVVVIDPPWPMEKIERDVRPNQSTFAYPTMTEAELIDLHIPAADDCHVWVWTTQRFLSMALRLLEPWKLRYVCTFVWHKPGGFQPIGLPQYNCEFAIYARRGTPAFIDTKAFATCFNAARGAHSEKPQEFYDTVARVTAGRRLDMFSRRAIPDFDGWGKEAAE